MNTKHIFISAFVVAVLFSCGGGDSNTELEKEKLKLEREKLEFEKSKATQGEDKVESTPKEENKEADEKRRKEAAQNASKANRFTPYTEAVVVVNKTFFYSMPTDGSQKRAFLVEGDIITVEKSQRNFVYVTFTNAYNGKVTSGWIKSDDLEPIYAD
ncbi:MAG: hypothetical protein FJX84_08300 [Bacteroidetes bacterium]|nr:hypothetical protein [Bacteroidota bacterium]